jgi:hypothetical protein
MGTWKPVLVIIGALALILLLFGVPLPIALLGGLLGFIAMAFIALFFHLFFHPATLIILTILTSIVMYQWWNLDDEILKFGKSKPNHSVLELLNHLGYSALNKEDCAFITCMVYIELQDMETNGLISTDKTGALGLDTVITHGH